MRVAVGLFGHLRSHQATVAPLRENIVDVYNADVFLHAWSTLDAQSTTWWCSERPSSATLSVQADDVRKLYNPTRMIIEDQLWSDEYNRISFGNEAVPLESVMFMFHSIQQCLKLISDYEKQNSIKYDLVIMLRPDVLIKSGIDATVLANEIATKSAVIFFPLNARMVRAGNRIFPKFGAMDAFFASNSRILSEIFSARLGLRTYFKNFLMIFPSTKNPEVVLQAYLAERCLNA